MDIYFGPPDLITYDAKKNFVSREFRQYATSLGITMKSVSVEVYLSIRIIERAHPELQRAYNIVMEELSGKGVLKYILLQIAIKPSMTQPVPTALF